MGDNRDYHPVPSDDIRPRGSDVSLAVCASETVKKISGHGCPDNVLDAALSSPDKIAG